MSLIDPLEEEKEFFYSAIKDLELEITSSGHLFHVKHEEILSIYRYFTLYILFSESGELNHRKIVDKINETGYYDSQEILADAGMFEVYNDLDLIPYFKKFLSPDYIPPNKPREIANMLLAFSFFYRDIPEWLRGDRTKLLLVIEIALARTVGKAFDIMGKIKWSELREKYRQTKAREGQKRLIDEQIKRMRATWDKIPELDKKKKDYTIARKMASHWEWKDVPNARTFVKYIRELREKNN